MIKKIGKFLLWIILGIGIFIAIFITVMSLLEQKKNSELDLIFEKLLKNRLKSETFNKKVILEANSIPYKELKKFLKTNKDILFNNTQEIISIRSNLPDSIYYEKIDEFEVFISDIYSDDSLKIPKLLRNDFSKIKEHILQLYDGGIQIRFHKNGQINIIFSSLGNYEEYKPVKDDDEYDYNRDVTITHELIYDFLDENEAIDSKDTLLQENIKYRMTVMRHID